jgi:hypothetical protein
VFILRNRADGCRDEESDTDRSYERHATPRAPCRGVPASGPNASAGTLLRDCHVFRRAATIPMSTAHALRKGAIGHDFETYY